MFGHIPVEEWRCDRCIYWYKNPELRHGDCRENPGAHMTGTPANYWCGKFCDKEVYAKEVKLRQDAIAAVEQLGTTCLADFFHGKKES